MDLPLPVVIHLIAALPALALGALQLAAVKGTPRHRMLGWLWVLAMAAVALSSFWIFGIAGSGRYSWIHLLSVWTLFSLGAAIWAVRRGRLRAHKYFMVGTFLGLAVAGLGALAPGRLLYRLLLA